MDKFVLILGAQAVGKMTVGEQLEKNTELKLFHGHMTIELVSKFFNYGTASGKKLVKLFREEIFNECIKSDMYGIIFTYVCAFDVENDISYVNNLIKYFESNNVEVYVIELVADIEIRKKRNLTPHRLNENQQNEILNGQVMKLLDQIKNIALVSTENEVKATKYIKIHNDEMSAVKVANVIKSTFKL